jgi:hypothetical protein
MNKLLSFVFGIGVSVLSVAAAQAMSFHPVHAGFVIPVGSGCGIGVYRGPYDRCDPIYGGYYSSYYRGYYDGYYHSPGRSRLVDQGACSGRRLYRVCNVYGECWAVCD